MSLFLEVLIVLWEFHKALFFAMYSFFVPPAEKSVKNELVLITGAGSGLGRLMCLEFARRGASVIACDINNQGNHETAEMVKAQGGTICEYYCDVSSKENIFKLAETIKQEVGDVTILVNNAGIVTGKLFMEIPDHMIQKTVDVNLLAHFWTVRAFMPAMLERNHGHIVNVASIAGIVGTTRMTDYCAAKFGDVGFTESLDHELVAAGKTGIVTTTVCPYFINTGMFNGCVPRFPSMLPALEPEPTVEKIMRAILINQTLLYIPRTMYFLALLKFILPVKAAIVLHKFTGATTFMDNFKGRTEQRAKDE